MTDTQNGGIVRSCELSGKKQGECPACGGLACPDCGSHDTYEDDGFRLHCFECGKINDSYIVRGPP